MTVTVAQGFLRLQAGPREYMMHKAPEDIQGLDEHEHER